VEVATHGGALVTQRGRLPPSPAPHSLAPSEPLIHGLAKLDSGRAAVLTSLPLQARAGEVELGLVPGLERAPHCLPPTRKYTTHDFPRRRMFGFGIAYLLLLVIWDDGASISSGNSALTQVSSRGGNRLRRALYGRWRGT
jgi:hypothetical protein